MTERIDEVRLFASLRSRGGASAKPSSDERAWLAALKREARDPGTPPFRLLQIAAVNASLARRVAMARTTSAGVLRVLCAHADRSVALAVARHPSSCSVALGALARHEDARVRQAVAWRRDLPDGALATLVADPRNDLGPLVSSNTRRIGDLPEVLASLLTVDDVRVRRIVAAHVPLSAANTRRLFDDPAPEVTASLVHNQRIPDRVRWLERLFTHVDVRVRAHAARWTLDPVHRTRFAVDPDPRVRAAVAASGRLEATLREALAADPDESVRFRTARGGETFDAAARNLARDASARVRTAVALRWGHVAPDLLEALAAEPDELARLCAAAHGSASSDLLERLALDPSTRTFELARYREEALRTTVSGLAADRLAAGDRWRGGLQPHRLLEAMSP